VALKLLYAAATGQFDRAFKSMNKPIAKAVVGAFRETGKAIVDKGRADIKAGGFGSRFQRAYTATVFPRQNPAAARIEAISLRIKSRLGFIAIFENGGTIRGKPLLWLPLPGVPAKIGGKRMTPRLFVQTFGKLTRIDRPGKAPLLFGPARGVKGPRIGAAALRRGAAGGGVNVPIFVGVKEVHVKARIHVNEIVQREAAQLPVRYAELFVDG
jgi:hypothetical protein